jgi:predicted ATPase/class 3 adenylate cyclase
VIDGERKTLTALFADIKGSTELMEGLDPEEARAIIDPALKLMIDAVRRYDGYVVQSTGDGIFALFGAPVAHEDHPQRAVHAAIAARDDLRRRGDDLRKSGRAGVEVRIGINTGEVVMRSVQTGDHTEYSPIGHVINVASRMQSVAPADGIVVSEETRRLVEGYFELRALGPTALKGIAGPIDVYEVVATGALRSHFDVAARRGLTKFVGRERELEQLQSALKQATDGCGQIVAVMAEAGTGKSRLVYEFKATIPKACKVLEAYSVSHGKASAWLPVLELLRKYFGIAEGDDAATRREKVRASFTELDGALDDTLPYLYGLLGIVEGADPIAHMDPQIKRGRLLDAIKGIVVRESLNQPVVVIFEDLHWIDEQTEALLDLLADSIATRKILLLVNYRPEYSDQWHGKTYYSRIRLDPLADANGAAMLVALLGDAVELNPLKRLVIERTGGNPFFIEEIVQALFDEGALIRNGAVKVTRSLSQLRLPPTVQGILAARIDRQPAAHKQLLQTLSVIGREASLGLVTQVASHSHTQLEPMLTELRAGEFIYEQPSATGVEYVFKHALTQEVAYNSLLIERRKQLHELAGQALESIFAGQLDDHLTQLAHHYTRSDNLDKAIEYLSRAGQQAIQRSAYANAISNLSVAIDLLQKLPDSSERVQRELRLQMALGGALMSIKGQGAPEAGKAYARALELSRQLAETPRLFTVLGALSVFHLAQGEVPRAHELVEQLLRLAENLQTPALLQAAHFGTGVVLFSLGELTQSRAHLELAITLYDPQKQHFPAFQDPGVGSLSMVAIALWTLGYPDQALMRIRESLALAKELSHPFSLADALNFAAELFQLRQEEEATREQAEVAIALSREQGLTLLEADAITFRGWALAKQGRNKEGIAQVRRGLAAIQATGGKLWQLRSLALLAEACGEAGQPEEGLTALAEAFDLANRTGRAVSVPELYRLKGELLLMQNDSNVEEAENSFRRAIEIACKQSAKSWELRATMSLARLLRDTGRRDEARAKLTDIYNWFTEGFDTADLKEAKALLDELST